MYMYNCALVRVIDGDTIDVLIDLGFDIHLKERVRLSSIDTAEIFGSKAVAAGQVSKEFVGAWMQQAKSLILFSQRYNAREKYGRVLGEFYRVLADGSQDTIPLGAALKIAGMAKVDPPKSPA